MWAAVWEDGRGRDEGKEAEGWEDVGRCEEAVTVEGGGRMGRGRINDGKAREDGRGGNMG